MEAISEQIEDVVRAYPKLKMSIEKDGYSLRGVIEMYASYNDIPLYDEYELEINILNQFPCVIPNVREMQGKVASDFQHFLDDGCLCLGVRCDIYDYLENHHTVLEFINDIVISYLYTSSYFIRYGDVPYGERSHGLRGVEEAFLEHFNVNTEEKSVQFLAYIVGIKQYRGHELCPCGSGKKLRNCHGMIILKDLKSLAHAQIRYEAIKVLHDFVERRRRQNEKRSATKRSI